ncbi:MAG: hypothetical protein WAU58_09095 [Terriglobales bacterium]
MGRLIRAWMFVAATGALLFAAGLTILHLNPYWRIEPNSAVIDHRAGQWMAVGHMVAALGLLCLVGSPAIAVVLLLARRFKRKWLYWSAAVALPTCMVVLWLAGSGTSADYNAVFHWDSAAGVTAFRVTMSPPAFDNPLWQRIMRWQVEPDLDGYLSGAGWLQRTDGDVVVTVVRFVPIAFPTALGSDGEVLHNTQTKRP